MRVLFMGTPSYATEILKTLLQDSEIEVVGLVTQPDKPVGRKQILTPPDTKKYLIENSIEMEVYQPTTLKSEEALQMIKSFSADFIIVAAYGQILPKSILDLAPCINLHASILPAYRGASPIQDAIKSQEKYSGVTSMLMDVGLDTGDILGFSFLNIEKLNASELFEQLAIHAATLTIDTLKNFENIKPIEQSGSEASYSKKIRKEDGLLDLIDAKSCEAKFRAFIFWPGVFLESGLKLKEISMEDTKSSHNIGKILAISDDSIVLGCQVGSLKVTRVQPPSKKEMSVVDYIRGKRLGIGDNLS
ncbi:MAG TPA: methionyl-tRNA formyltransferase [Campylobacterales bacterium]|nr:methionyl-tRNA formyltransferase [Campylobacterales bacterium]